MTQEHSQLGGSRLERELADFEGDLLLTDVGRRRRAARADEARFKRASRVAPVSVQQIAIVAGEEAGRSNSISADLLAGPLNIGLEAWGGVTGLARSGESSVRGRTEGTGTAIQEVAV